MVCDKLNGLKEYYLSANQGQGRPKSPNTKKELAEMFGYVQTGILASNLLKIRKCVKVLGRGLDFKNFEEAFMNVYKNGLTEISSFVHGAHLTYFEQEEYVLQNISSQETLKDFIDWMFFGENPDGLDPKYFPRPVQATNPESSPENPENLTIEPPATHLSPPTATQANI